MVDIIIVLIVIVLLGLALKGSIKHFKGEAACCGGGGGFNGIGKFRPQRDKGLYMKLQQIRETGAKMVISPCHNCWDAIRDMMEVYHVHDIKWSFLKPIIIDMMIVPDHLKPQDDE